MPYRYPTAENAADLVFTIPSKGSSVTIANLYSIPVKKVCTRKNKLNQGCDKPQSTRRRNEKNVNQYDKTFSSFSTWIFLRLVAKYPSKWNLLLKQC